MRSALPLFFVALALPGAAVELPYANEATRDLLLRALHDRDRIQRIRAVEALADAGDPRNAAPLAEVARTDAIPAVRAQATADAAIPPFADAAFRARPAPPPDAFTFAQPDPRLRREARLRALRDDPAFAADFRPLLDDPDYFVRRAVSDEVVRRRGVAVASQWRELFASTNADLQVEAAWAAAELRDAASEPSLIACLGASFERLRLLAVAALARVGGDATRAALPAALERAEGATREELIRLTIGLKATSALPQLCALAVNPGMPQTARALSLEALGALADPSARDAVLTNLRNPSPATALLRERAAAASAALGLTEALPALRRFACEKAINIPMVGPSYDADATRIACARAIARLGGAPAIQAVAGHACLEESSEEVRKAVAEAMTSATGVPYAWRQSVSFRSWFLLSLAPEEMPPDLAANQKMPPVVPVSATPR